MDKILDKDLLEIVEEDAKRRLRKMAEDFVSHFNPVNKYQIDVEFITNFYLGDNVVQRPWKYTELATKYNMGKMTAQNAINSFRDWVDKIGDKAMITLTKFEANRNYFWRVNKTYLDNVKNRNRRKQKKLIKG